MVPLTRKERDRQLRQQDILKAAEHVFATKGYHKAAIQDIARQAQYAAGTIYLYFKDKEALYLALVEKKIDHFTSVIKDKVVQVEDINQKLKVLVKEQLSYFSQNRDFMSIYFSEREGMRWTIKDKLSAATINKLMQHIDYIAGIIKKAQEKNIIRGDYDAKRLALALSSIMNTVMLRWFIGESNKIEDFDDASVFVLDVFLHGARQKK